MVKIAIILSGCGYLDGAEIHESVLTILYLSQQNAQLGIFAPDIPQMHTVNHLTQQHEGERRNVLVESARIARSQVRPLSELLPAEWDALVMPGGYGVAKNLSNFASKGKAFTVDPLVKDIIRGFYQLKKPIGAICVSPIIVTAALADLTTPKVTIGDDKDNLIATLGGEHCTIPTAEMVYDEPNLILSCSAYMRKTTIVEVAKGIEKLALHLVKLCT